jgi:hypothetical protein
MAWLAIMFMPRGAPRGMTTILKIKRSGWQGNLVSKNLLYALSLDGLLQSAVPLASRVSLT